MPQSKPSRNQVFSRSHANREQKLTRQGTQISTRVPSPPKNVFMQTYKLRQEMQYQSGTNHKSRQV